MAVLQITLMGHPLLRRRAAPVTDVTDSRIRSLLADMGETMRDAPGVGLAAPQVGVGVRAMVFEVPATRLGTNQAEIPQTVLINPLITPLDDTLVLGWEGCLSVPGLRGLVPRYAGIHYRGWDVDGSLVEGEAKGFHARVIQHEYDHLDGVLYVDRMTDLRLLIHESEYENFRLEDYLENDEPGDDDLEDED